MQNYIGPWIKWLKEQGESCNPLITSNLLCAHLEQRFQGKSAKSFDQTGRAICRFMNAHLSERIHVLKRMEVKINEDNVNMPAKSMESINMQLKHNIAQLRGTDLSS